MLGYEVTTDVAMDILEGRWEKNAPEGTDEPTKELFKEMAHLWKMMQGGEVDIVITVDNFQHYWRRMKERKASSILKLLKYFSTL